MTRASKWRKKQEVLSLKEFRTKNPILWLPLGLSLALLAFTLLPRVNEQAVLLKTFLWVPASLVFGLFVVIQRLRTQRGAPKFKVQIVRPHYVQPLIHLCIFTYWGMYWPNVFPSMPLIFAQVLFLYAFDSLLSWYRGRTWHAGFGPFPIVFSTNLFLWFKDDWFHWQFVMIAAGVLGKEFFRWNREGKNTHIFNPSAFSLSLFSLGLLMTGTTDYTWAEEISITLGDAPHMYLWIFAVSLVVQSLFAVTLMTLSAAVTMLVINLAYTQLTHSYFFIDTNIPIAVFLGLHLLFTDPSTSPRTSIGRILFGSLYGIGVFVLYALLANGGEPRFYDKLLCVPIMNLCVRMIDQFVRTSWVSRFQSWADRFSPPKINIAAIGVWSLVFGGMWSTGFVGGQHAGGTLQFWKDACDQGKPNGCENYLRSLVYFAEQGSGLARSELGLIYAQGELVPKDMEAAMKFFQMASEVGDARGSANLVNQFFHHGKGDAAAAQAALDQLEKEVDSDITGQYHHLLGLAYRDAKGRPKDDEKALEFFTRACEMGFSEACGDQARALLTKSGPESLAAALPLLQKGCAGDDAFSCFSLGFMYLEGTGVEQDLTQARALLEKACNLGNVQACTILPTIPGRQ